jgi:hypothetical protein
VPHIYAGKQLVLRAFPFKIEVLSLDDVIASHLRFVLDQVFQVVQPGVDVIPQVVQLFADQLRL